MWRTLPVDFPPWPTVYHDFRPWTTDGTLTALHGALREQIRHAEGRHVEPSAAILHSQSVRAAATVARSSRSYDVGKKVNGRKRHIAVDTTGRLLVVLITSAVNGRPRLTPAALNTQFTGDSISFHRPATPAIRRATAGS